MANIEREFALYAKERAEGLGRGLDWTKPPEATVADPVAFARWAGENTNNYWAILWNARDRAARQDWSGVTTLLRPVDREIPRAERQR